MYSKPNLEVDADRSLRLFLIVLGAALRLGVYLAHAPLWGDEGTLAYNLIRPPIGVLGDTSFGQVIPAGFLLSTWLTVQLLGTDEYALRLIPLLASLAALPLFWLLASRVLGRPAALLALALFAVAPYSIFYGAVLKQYGVDVLMGTVLSLAALKAQQPDLSKATAWRLGLLGLVVAPFSHSSVLLLPALGLGVLVSRSARESGSERALAPMAALWTLGAIVAGAASIVGLGASGVGFMKWYWREAFLPTPVTPSAWMEWGRAIVLLFRDPMGLAVPVVGLLALAFGLWKGPRVLLLLLAPLVPAFLLSTLELYPSGLGQLPIVSMPGVGRLYLFALPALLIGMAAGAEWLLQQRRWVGVLLATLLLPLGSAIGTLQTIRATGERDIRTATEYVLDNAQPGDRVVVEHWITPLFLYHLDRESFASSWPRLDRLDLSLGFGRTWFIFWTMDAADPFALAADLSRSGVVLDRFAADGHSVYLVDIEQQVYGALEQPQGAHLVIDLTAAIRNPRSARSSWPSR